MVTAVAATSALGTVVEVADLGRRGKRALCIVQDGSYGVQLDGTAFVVWCGGRHTALCALRLAEGGDFLRYGQAWADLTLASYTLPNGPAMDAVRSALRTIEAEARRDLGL